MAERVVPYSCPYCGEDDIRPFGERHGDWRCGACLRAWRLSYLGLTGRGDVLVEPASSGGTGASDETAPPDDGAPHLG